MRYFKIIFWLIIFGANVIVNGQGLLSDNQKLKFQQFSLRDGLSQSSVLCILQDREGFLWFGTRDGLNKFDGYNFTTYRYNSKDPNSLSNSFIRSLFEDEDGKIWIGTNNGLNKYNSKTENFERYRQPKYQSDLASNQIWDITSRGDGFLWLGTNLGLRRFDLKTFNSTVVDSLSIKTDTDENAARSLLITEDGELWICKPKAIEVYNPKSKKFRSYEYPQFDTKAINRNYAPVIYQDAQFNLWLGHKNGLSLFDKEANIFEPYQLGTDGVKAISDEIRSIKQDAKGNLWVGTYNGLYVINLERQTIFHYLHDENDSTSLSQNSIYSIYEDIKGDFWIGTYAGGVNFYDRSYDAFKSLSSGTNNSKLNYKVVSSIIEDPKKNLWIGTEGGGINFYDKAKGLFTYITHDPANPNSLSTDNVKSMIRTHDGNYWVGTHDGGLNFLDTKNRPYSFKIYVNDPENVHSLSSNRIISLYEDAQQDIWIGTSGGGLNFFDYETQTISRIIDPLNDVGEIVYDISKTSDKHKLLISGNNGLAKIDVNTKKLERINYKTVDQDLGHSHATLYAYEAPNQNLWIATEGDGLYHYNQSTKKSTKYGLSEGLPNEVIYGILPDNLNSLWLSTNNGLSRLDLSSKTFKNYEVTAGLVGNEFNYAAFEKLQSGELMFGGANGLTYFDPKDIIENTFIPPVSITSVLVNNQPLDPSMENSKRDIKLNYKQNNVSFKFVALNYSQPTKNQYAYKLEGFDENWVNIGNNKSATYTNLNADDYVFKVKASNNDGLWNEEGASFSFTVKPAPWFTWWAFLIYALGIIGVLLMIRRYSILRIHEKNQLKQERLEKERMEEINHMKLRLFTNISHDFRTPLTLIIGPLERMLSQKRGGTYVQRQHEIMHRNASVLLQLINQLLDFRKSESGHLKLSASKRNIVPFIENIKLSFDELARLRGIDYTFSAKENDIEVWFDKINLKKVIYNLLSNAFKFTPNGGKIAIKVSVVTKKKSKLSSSGFVKLVIKDTGKGVAKEYLKFIFDRFYQLGQDETARSGTGIGLALTKSLVELHQGSIKAKSKEGEGTNFTVLLPLGDSHLSSDEKIDNDKDTASGSFYFNTPNYMVKEMQTNESDDEHEEIEEDHFSTTLLIVEDNTDVRQFIKSIFEMEYEILEAENGEMAIEIANNNKVDLIISDLMMPKMDGIELCNHIKGNMLTSHIPVLLLTAKTSEDAQKQGYQIGADAYITKPFNANILELKVHNLLQTRRNLIDKFRKDIILEPSKPEVANPDEEFLQKAIGLVEENLSNSDFTIQEFVSEMGMSRSALYRKLKALTDQSITTFIRTVKLKRAGQLIAQTDLNISEIAFDLGFNDLKHFRKSFQKLFDELPSEYRTNRAVDSKDIN